MKSKYNQETLQKNLIREVTEYGTLYYCIAKKESNSGLMQNERLLVLQESDLSIFYTKNIPTKPYSKISTMPSGKLKLKLSEIKFIKSQDSANLSITLEKQKILWNFIFSSPELAHKFSCLIEQMQEKIFQNSIYRKSMKSTKSKSTLHSQHSFRNTHISPLKKQMRTLYFGMEEDSRKIKEEKNLMSRIGSEIKIERIVKEKNSEEIVNKF